MMANYGKVAMTSLGNRILSSSDSKSCHTSNFKCVKQAFIYAEEVSKFIPEGQFGGKILVLLIIFCQ
jgi:hypothetical protein